MTKQLIQHVEKILRCFKPPMFCLPASSLIKQGYQHLQNNSLTEAEKYFRRALAKDPHSVAARSHLGQTLRLKGDLCSAEKILLEAIAYNPADGAVYNRLATTLRQLGKDQEAEIYFRKGLAVEPGNADILNNLGSLLNQHGYLPEATTCFEEAVAHEPTHITAKCNLCLNLSDRGLHIEADRCFQEAITMDPHYYHARISYVMNKLSAIHNSQAELEESREQYAHALHQLIDWLNTQPETTWLNAAETVGWISPFYLTYQGKNDKELQSLYGTLLCKLMHRCYPQWSSSLPMPPTNNTPLRIGIVSAYFYDHSNWKTPISGWLEQLDRTHFEVYGYYTGNQHDTITDKAHALCHRFYQGLNFENFAQQIRADNLHALIYPEVSMDPLSVKLATLRLAPIQYNSWGHPDTSGMPTIDYYLSSELMEPDDAQAFYTEQIARLPNLSICYTPPNYTAASLDRRDLNLPEEKILYCCAQSIFKYLPQFDFIFVEIAKRVPHAKFVFFGHQRAPELYEKFLRRLNCAFEKEQLNAADYIITLPRLNRAEFQAVLSVCDIYLDSVEWSGCNTTLEAFLQNLPALTYKGSTLRGRHTYAFLTMMKLDQYIAHTLTDYIELAVKFGLDSNFRQKARSDIQEHFHKICYDTSCVRGLEQYLNEHINTYKITLEK